MGFVDDHINLSDATGVGGHGFVEDHKSLFGGFPLLNWVNPVVGVNRGVLIPELTWWSSANLGMTMEFDIRLNDTSHVQRQGFISRGDAGDSSKAFYVSAADEITLTPSHIRTIPGLDLYDGQFHHVLITRPGNTNTDVKVDDFPTVTGGNPNPSVELDHIAGGATTAGYFSLNGVIKNFTFITAGAVLTHDLPINEGVGETTIINNGTEGNGVIVGTVTTDYEWI